MISSFRYCFKRNKDGYFKCNLLNGRIVSNYIDLEQDFPIVFKSLVTFSANRIKISYCDSILIAWLDKYGNIIVRIKIFDYEDL